jgi:AAA15 family ATPase/GTPase
MSDSYFRLLRVGIENFKNINSGTVFFNERKELIKGNFELQGSALLGIYGQNGSGKTGIIDALDILHEIASSSLPKNSGSKVQYQHETTTLSFEFLYHHDNLAEIVEYSVILKPFRGIGHFNEERVTVKEFDGKNWGHAKTIIAVKSENGSITPQEIRPYLKDIEEVLLDFKKDQSFVFNPLVISKLLASNYQYANLLRIFQYELETNLIIINSTDDGTIYLDSCTNLDLPTYVEPSNLKIDLFKTNYFTKEEYELVKTQIAKNNLALTQIIPGLSVVSNEQSYTSNGETKYAVEFFSLREHQVISLVNESQGIKRIISLVGALIATYNNPSVILAIDEFDAGVFEYLIGDLLEVFKNEGEGQIIFTSHNLRVLELLTAQDVVFTSYKSVNRFVRLKGVGKHTNLRDAYLRNIFLNEGGLATPTDQYSISRALRKAGTKNE